MTNTMSGSTRVEVYETKQGVRTKNRNWEELYQALAAFKARTGHFDLSQNHDDTGLSCFVAKLRRCRDSLTDTQRAKLDAIGFDLANLCERQDRSWNDKWERLKEFRRLFGHANVPQTAVTDDLMEPWSDELGAWVSHQRTAHKKGKLAHDRLTKLNQIGFEFSLCSHTKPKDSTTDDQKWHAMYLQLKEYKRIHGDVNVSKPHRDRLDDPEEQQQRKLAQWVSTQRSLYTDNDLKPDRQHLLEQLGFVWKLEKGANTSDSHLWQTQFNAVCKFQATHGHCALPTKHSAFFWAHGQRRLYRQGTLLLERQEALDKIGFNWESKKRGWNMKDRTTNHILVASQLKTKRQRAGSIGGSASSKSNTNITVASANTEDPEGDEDNEMTIGTRVAVYWSDDEEFYEGQVTKKHKKNGTFFVEYDDGDEEWVDFQKSKFKRLAADENHVAKAEVAAAAVVSDDSHTNNEKTELLQKITKGTRVSVWWPAEKEYYNGVVMKICHDHKNPHYIWYDDGDSQQINLLRLKFKLLDDNDDNNRKKEHIERMLEDDSEDEEETDDDDDSV